MTPKLGIGLLSLIVFVLVTGCTTIFPMTRQVNAEGIQAKTDEEGVVASAKAVVPAAIEAEEVTDTPAMRVLFEEITLVHLLSELDGYAKTDCAGNGINHITPPDDDSIIVIPNAGDLSLAGSNVAIKLASDGELTFVPRTQGQLIRLPIDIDGKSVGEEVLSLSLQEARELMAVDELIWTAREQGPNRNGHGLPGHIAACDPQFED